MPFGTKRRVRVSRNVAGRYLAAIAGGGCGEMPTVGDPYISNATSNPLPIGEQHFDKASAPAAPKSPTNEEPPRSPFMSSATPLIPATAFLEQDLGMHLSPSAVTATSLDAFPQSLATSSSPTSRRCRGTPARSTVQDNRHNNPNENITAHFFNKIALRSSNKQTERRSVKAVTAPPPPPPPRRNAKDAQSSTSAWEPPKNALHLQPVNTRTEPSIEVVLKGPLPQSSHSEPLMSKPLGRTTNTLLRTSPIFSKYKFSKANSAAQPKDETASPTAFSDNVASEAASTEITTNRTFACRFVMDPSDALRRKKKALTPSHSKPSGDHNQHLVEEKQQDFEFYSRKQESPEHHQWQEQSAGRCMPPPSKADTGEPTEEDLLLFGPVPLERINTRRTSNRGEFSRSIPSAYRQPFQTIAARHHQPRSPQPETLHPPAQQPLSQSSARPPQPQLSSTRPHEAHKQAQRSPRYERSSPRSSPRLNRHLSKSEKPIDTKSLLSVSTNESSSAVSPQSLALLNPILNQAISCQGDSNVRKDSNHWWSVDNVRLTPISSPVVGGQNQVGGPKKKTVVAYPDSPPSYLKPQRSDPEPPRDPNPNLVSNVQGNPNEVISPNKDDKKDGSFETHKSDLGVIGLVEDGENDGDRNGPIPLEKKQSTIPKLAPSKIDPSKKKKMMTRAVVSSQRRAQTEMRPPKVQLKPRKNRLNDEILEEADPNMSIVSESSVWTPLAMSEDGLNFSSDKDAPLLPLFSQDRYEFFGPDESFPEAASNDGTKPTTKDKKLVAYSKSTIELKQNGNGHPQKQKQQLEAQGNALALQSNSVASPDLPNVGQASRPCPSPKIWRRREGEVEELASPDPIFCTQPSTSQPQPSSSQGETQSPVKLQTGVMEQHLPVTKSQAKVTTEKQPAVKTKHDANAAKQNPLPSPPSKNVGTPVRKWPQVRTNFDGNSSVIKLQPPPPPLNQTTNLEKKLDPPATSADLSRPKRSISGHVVPEGDVGKPYEDGFHGASLRRAETCTENDQEKSICSTWSLPLRAKSEQVRGKAEQSSPLRGSFKAAFAAFEKASAGQYNKAYFPQITDGGDLACGTQERIEKSHSFATSRLAMVLNVHLAIQASQSMDSPGAQQQQADTISVDVQSIRSNFEGVAPFDFDDDNVSVKSLREVFQSNTAKHPETAVSKMRALYEIKNAPTAKNFENSSTELRKVWNRFQSFSPPPKHPSSGTKVRESSQQVRPFSVPNARGPSHHTRPSSAPNVYDSASNNPALVVSVADRARNVQRTKMMTEIAHLVDVLEQSRNPEKASDIPSQKPTPPSGIITTSAGRWQPPLQDRRYARHQKVFGAQEPSSNPNDHHSPQNVVRNESKVEEVGAATATASPAPTDKEKGKDSCMRPPEQSFEDSIPSNRPVVPPAAEIVDSARPHMAVINVAPAGASALSDDIVSPPRLGIQTIPTDENRLLKDYLPKGFSPTSRVSKDRRHHAGDKETVSASEGEFSDGVTLDLSIADVSQLTNPTAIQSKGDDSTLGDFSAGEEKAIEIDLMDCEAKGSEVSSSQQTEAAFPLIARTLKRLSDDLSLESRNQITKLWEKSALLGDRNYSKSPGKESKMETQGDSNGWDFRHVEASFPSKTSPTSGAFFGFDEEPDPGWQTFEKSNLWPVDPFSTKSEVKDSAILPSSEGPPRDPEGFHFDGQLDASIHITEASIPQSYGYEDDSRSAPSDEVAAKLGCKSPPRTYDARSHVYTQAKKQAKAMLAARSPSRRIEKQSMHIKFATPSRASESESPQSGYPSPRSRATSTTSRSTTPPRSSTPASIIVRASPAEPATPPSRSLTSSNTAPNPKSSPTRPVTPPFRCHPPSQPVTPAQRAITPTISNLQKADSDSHVTPKVSHRRGDLQTVLTSPSKILLDEYPELWTPQNGFAPPLQRHGESKQDESFPVISPARIDFFSAKHGFSLPVFESKSLMPPLPDDNLFHHPPKQIDRESYNSALRNVGVFSPPLRLNDALRQRKHNAAANVQSFRTSPPKSRLGFVVPQQPASGQSSPKSPGGRLASVVGKHAALMARLKVLKAARIRRSAQSHPNGSDAASATTSSRPKSSISRALATVYRSTRRPSSNISYHVQSKCGPTLNELLPREEPVPAASPQHQSAFDPFLNNDFRDPSFGYDDFSDSAGSSTRFGGQAFAAQLELD